MMFTGIAVGGPSHGFIASLFGEKRVWMLVCNIIYIVAFSVVIIFTDFISSDNLYIIFFVIGFSVLSMLLVFSVVEEIFPPQIKSIVNMVIGLCGAIFQYLVSYISVYLNGGPLIGEININVFD